MHDPMVLAAEIRWLRLDIWHNEPGGHDAGEVCGYPPRGLRRPDLTGYVHGTADSDARWRAEYRLKGLDKGEVRADG